MTSEKLKQIRQDLRNAIDDLIGFKGVVGLRVGTIIKKKEMLDGIIDKFNSVWWELKQ